MRKRLLWIQHLFVGCPIPLWVRDAVSTATEGCVWRCPCGRVIERAAKVRHL